MSNLKNKPVKKTKSDLANEWMAEALREAEKAVSVSPNPRVGAVLVKSGRIVSRGHHRKFGGPHAEVDCFKRLKGTGRGATLVITLEPCNHKGKTPACTDLIIKQGIRHCIIGILDPNPLVSGKGIACLRRAGVRVTVLNSPRLNCFYSAYKTFHLSKRSHVTVKLAVTSDGKIADAKGNSKWITGPESRKDVHSLRAAVDAILVGTNTAVKDNPRLNVRLPGKRKISRPVRIILSSNSTLPRNLRMFNDSLADTWLVTTAAPKSNRKQICQTIVMPSHGKQVNTLELTKVLATLGITHLLVEGGGKTGQSFFKTGCVDTLVLYISPKLLYADGIPAFPDKSNCFYGMKLVHTRNFGKDVRLVYVRKK